MIIFSDELEEQRAWESYCRKYPSKVEKGWVTTESGSHIYIDGEGNVSGGSAAYSAHQSSSGGVESKGNSNAPKKPEGLSKENWKAMKEMAAEGKMPSGITGDPDVQAAYYKAVDRLYTDIDTSQETMDKYKITEQEGKNGSRNYHSSYKAGSMKAHIPTGYEDDKEVCQGRLKAFVHYIKQKEKE